MMDKALAQQFATSFQEAAGNSVSFYAGILRLIALSLVIIAVITAINHFLSDEQHSDNVLVQGASRAIRLVIGLTLFILLIS